MQTTHCDICVIGAGSAGLSVASGAAQLGRRTVLIERGVMGGDCLNYGCVPSKSLIAAARLAHDARHSAAFGIRAHEPQVDMAKVQEHVRGVIAGIAPNDSVERFEGLGVEVIKASARFRNEQELEVDGRLIRARRFVVAAGSRPSLPPVEGLAGLSFLTNETVFDLDVLPDHLIVMGGGPIGCELAQAFRRLGSAVTLVDIGPILPKDDPELTPVVRAQMEADGVRVRERVEVLAAEPGPALRIRSEGAEERIEGSHLLVATGRRPNTEDLGLEEAGIAYEKKGITVDKALRTSNRRVYAIGDITGLMQFTHVAGHHASLVIRNAVFRLPVDHRKAAVPWVTFTAPELAHVGLSEAMAKNEAIDVETARWPYAENDRAHAERARDGLIKVVTGRRGRVLGASIVGEHAGELILPWIIAVEKGMKLSALASLVAPYPTLGEISKRVAGAYYAPKLFNARTKRLVGLLNRIMP